MKNILIKKAEVSDIESLVAISRQTFVEAFSADNTEENMTKYIEDSFSPERLASELGNKESQFYFAISGDKIVGYLKLNFGQSQTDLKDNDALEIERIYVLTDFLRKGVGQLFYEKAMEIAKSRKARYVWLGVWEENARAISFYKKNGFVEFDKHFFMLGDDKQTDIMMKLIIG